MRLNTRLSKLEQQAPGTEHADLFPTLIELLARRDALFWPWREHQPTVPRAAIKDMQREYIEGKAGTKIKAAGSQDWKSAHELRKRLIDVGFCRGCYSGGEITSLILTEVGEFIGRELTYLYGFLHALPTLKRLMEIMDGRTDVQYCWVSESALFNNGIQLYGCPNDWEYHTETILPLLTCGMVQCNSDMSGAVAYRIRTDQIPEKLAVRPRAKTLGKRFIEVEGTYEYTEANWKHYLKAFNAERAYLSGMAERDSAEVFIPLRRLDYDLAPSQFETAQ